MGYPIGFFSRKSCAKYPTPQGLCPMTRAKSKAYKLNAGSFLFSSTGLGCHDIENSCIPQVSLQTESELQEPCPLCLHCLHVSLDDWWGRVPGDDEWLAAVLHRGELGLSPLQLRHQLLVIPLDLKTNTFKIKRTVTSIIDKILTFPPRVKNLIPQWHVYVQIW